MFEFVRRRFLVPKVEHRCCRFVAIAAIHAIKFFSQGWFASCESAYAFDVSYEIVEPHPFPFLECHV